MSAPFSSGFSSGFATDTGGGPVTGAFFARAIILAPQSGSFTANAVIVTGPPTVQILYEGDDITDDVIIRSARFQGMANGGVGSAYIVVKDQSHAYAPGYFHFGGTLELYIEGERAWDGLVSKVGRQWFFDVDDTSQPMATPRGWVIQGFDRNIFLQKRMIFDQDDPRNPIPDQSKTTTDQEALVFMLDNFVDQSGTGLDWTSGINEIDIPSVDEAYVLGEVGQPAGLLFEDVAGQTGGVYSVGPDRVVRYTDDMTITAPFILSDTPDGVTSFGYREVEDVLVSDEMANDALVWGAGKGSSQPVFYRHQDTDSIAAYGRWQWADIWSGAYKTATVQKRARTYVEGSAQHRRGHKDPLPDVRLKLFKHGLRAGQVARFIHSSYGVDRHLPIRSVTMTFPTPTDVMYEVNLSLIYDTPFGTIDPWWNDGGHPPPGGWDGGGNPNPDCAVLIDEFDRTVDGYWGVATSGANWLPNTVSNGASEVSGTEGWGIVLGGTDAPVIGYNWLDFQFASIPRVLLFRWRFRRAVDDATLTDYSISFMAVSDPSTFTTDGPDQNGLYAHRMSDTDENYLTEAVDWHLTRMLITPSGWSAKTWLESGDEPDGWAESGDFGVEVTAADMWIYLDWIHASGNEGTRFECDYIRDVSAGVDGPCGDVDNVIDTWGRSLPRDATDQEDLYHTWEEWYEWRVISAGPTYAHGQSVLHVAPVSGDGFLEVWHDDVVHEVPGTGNPLGFPNNPPPDVEWDVHAGFDRFRYVFASTGSTWGAASDGVSGSWVSIAGKAMMQGAYNGAGIAFPNEDADYGYAYLTGLAFEDGSDLILKWRSLGRANIAVEPKLFFCGHEVATTWESMPGGVYYQLDENWKFTRVQLSGSTFRAKTWGASELEPGTWDIEEAHTLDAPLSGWSGANASHVSIAVALHQYAPIELSAAKPYSEFQFDTLYKRVAGVYGDFSSTGSSDAQNTAAAWDGARNIFQTRYPYQPGSLRVWIDGIELTTGQFVETQPDNGLFTLGTEFADKAISDLSQSMQVRYRRASDSQTDTLPPAHGSAHGYTGNRVYRPHIVQQYGWGTYWDGHNCTAASSTMCLDRHTLGALTPWKGTPRNVPPAHRSFSGHFDVNDPGLSMGDMETSWSVGWGRTLTYLGQISFTLFENMINQGRGAIVAGLYGSLPNSLRFSSTFTGGHAIYVNEQFSDGSFLVYDPLSRRALIYSREIMYRYTTQWTGTGLVNVSFSRPTAVS